MLFQSPSLAYVSNQDTLTATTPTVPSTTIGNPNLVAEVGHTKIGRAHV